CWPPATWTAPSSGCRRPARRSCRSRPSSRGGLATAPSATPPATWSASRNAAGIRPGGDPAHPVVTARLGTLVTPCPRDLPRSRPQIGADRAQVRGPVGQDGDVMGKTSDPRPLADSHDWMRVQGARENNLTDVDLAIPKRRLTVFTGVSGSGKSSLVFGTIAA